MERLPDRIQAKTVVGTLPPDPYLRPWKLGVCWVWMGARTSRGYGSIHDAAAYKQGAHGSRLAHVAVYELLVGPVPKGLELDHLCRVPLCVNPAHLEPVTHQENVLRGDLGRRKTHCKYGHEFDEKNTRINKRTGERICRTCHRNRERRRRMK